MAEKKGQSLEEQSLEEIFSDLEQTIKKMEEGEISLEDRKSTRLNSSHITRSRMPSSA